MSFVNVVLQGVLLGGLYALLGCGLSLMFGVMRIVNLAHGDVAVAAAFLAVLAIDQLGLSAVGTLVLVVPAIAAVGYAVQRGLLNRALRIGPLAPLLVTLGAGVVLRNVLQQAFSADSQGLQAGALSTSTIHVGNDITLPVFDLLTLATAVVVIGAVAGFLQRTALGRRVRATADDPQTAALTGVDPRHIYAVATAIAFATVALAGVFVGIRSSFTPSTGPQELLFAFEAVIIGGLGSLWGTLAGGTVLGVAQTVGAHIDPSMQLLAGHLVFLLVLLLRPQGFFAKAAIA
ncbi:branched-chain amino acid ABC transporter permease [Candidatus Solirubrobacter pratensis]|uniref:branched-chain amino acid ABC transporter permease n=1 Tax=Candidatus Solirubrobacter pratensis TaxID=1298857 RepID=UPI000408A7B0|nr:branched-chain amino acid ABC transporter permease [Candidatus Solirubrobacter pratensis]